MEKTYFYTDDNSSEGTKVTTIHSDWCTWPQVSQSKYYVIQTIVDNSVCFDGLLCIIGCRAGALIHKGAYCAAFGTDK